MNDKIQYAIRLLNEMEYEQGIEILKDVLTEDPKNDVALYNLALAYNSINEPENAIETFDIYLAHYKKDPSVLAGLGYSYYLNGDIEKSKEILEEAVELNPGNIDALRNLAGVLANLGDIDKAEKLFKQILEIEPKNYRTLTGLGMIYFQKEDYDKAENCFYQVMDLPIPEEVKDPAREYLTKIAAKTLKKDGFRVDAVMYLVSAINLYKNMDLEGIKKVAFEIATLGQNGFDINDPKKTYKVPALQGNEISGLCAICYMYVGFKKIDPSLDTGIDLADEFNQASILSETGIM